MEKTLSEIRFENEFNKLFPNTRIFCFRYGTEERVYQIHYFIPLDNRYLKGSNYYIDIPSVYSHFTSLESTRGIMSSKSLRLYNINKSNDPREYRYAGINEEDPEKLSDSLENLFTISFVNLNKDKKGFMSNKFNMWRLYGDNGEGCFIDFEFTNNLPSDWHEFHFAPIRYGIERKKNIMKLKSFIKRMDPEKEKIGIDIDPLPCFHKAGIYRIENEYRLLYDGRFKKGYLPREITINGKKIFPKIVEYQTAAEGKSIKYLDLPIFPDSTMFSDDNIPMIRIKSITIGYRHKYDFNDLKLNLENLALENLGYLPDIKLSSLSKTFWGK
jgi:hypothetical protein